MLLTQRPAPAVISVDEVVNDKSWLIVFREKLEPLANNRNAAMATQTRTPSSNNLRRLRRARQEFKTAIFSAKEEWTTTFAKSVENGQKNGGTMKYWEAVRKIKAGWNETKRVTHMKFKKKDGTWCETNKETVERVAEVFEENLNIKRDFDRKLLEHIKDEKERVTENPDAKKVLDNLENVPTIEEVRRAIGRTKSEKAAGDNGIPAEFYQALASSEEGLEQIGQVIAESWQGTNFEEWKLSKLKILPKKGDLSDPNNWRPIMLLDVLQKIMSSIIAQRLQDLLKIVGIEEQYGFLVGRGTTDGVFVVKEATNKRRNAGEDSWVLFVDLVKAFDSVPRDGMLAILQKFGIKGKMWEWIANCYTDVTVKATVEGESITFSSDTGVKQGDNLSPVLFLFVIQAFIELLENKKVTGEDWPEKTTFRTRPDGVLSNRHPKPAMTAKNNVSDTDLAKSLYADDQAFIFTSRPDLIRGSDIIYRLLVRFGLMMHVGKNDGKSKTEAMLIPGLGRKYEDGDTSDYIITSSDGGTVQFTKSFKYLGSVINSDGTDDEDIDNRITCASKIFGSMRFIFRTKKISLKNKGQIFVSFVLPVLLYGAETWRIPSLASPPMQKLRVFSHRCVRSMNEMDMEKTRRHRITSYELQKRMGLRTIESFRRQLQATVII